MARRLLSEVRLQRRQTAWGLPAVAAPATRGSLQASHARRMKCSSSPKLFALPWEPQFVYSCACQEAGGTGLAAPGCCCWQAPQAPLLMLRPTWVAMVLPAGGDDWPLALPPTKERLYESNKFWHGCCRCAQGGKSPHEALGCALPQRRLSMGRRWRQHITDYRRHGMSKQ